MNKILRPRCGQKKHAANPQHHKPSVCPVRQAPDRKLGEHAAQNAEKHEKGGLFDRQAVIGGIYRAERVKNADENAADHTADHTFRTDFI